ncbi:MAG: AzlD domain-containing protein [Syntrophomonadaceae bacterium]|nr:AzlD domain-containing protein [Syntrophomonadaceae bacterium]
MDALALLVVSMGLVTYLPRMLPLTFLNDMRLPRFVNSFLRFVPFAALGALIFPGILSSTGNVNSAVIGGVAAMLLALGRVNITLVVFGGILGAYLGGLLL